MLNIKINHHRHNLNNFKIILCGKYEIPNT